MKVLIYARIRAVLLLVLLPQVVGPSGVVAQRIDLQPGNKARVDYGDVRPSMVEGKVTETWDGGFAIEVKGASRPRHVDFAEVASLQRALRVGSQARKGALIGGGILGGLGFLGSYCYGGCQGSNFEAGLESLLPSAAVGALIGAGFGLMGSRYGPWEAVDVGGRDRSSDLDRIRVGLVPSRDGRVGLGVMLTLGGGS